MIIGINGKINSGKDTVGSIIQYLTLPIEHGQYIGFKTYDNITLERNSSFKIKKFAGKLKTIASLLTGVPVEKFEDQEFKKALLGEEWGTVRHNPLNNIEPFEKFQFNELMSVREFLQKLGTEAMRDGLHTNVWVNALFADYKYEIHRSEVPTRVAGFIDQHVYPNWIITDMRFPNEMEAVEEREGLTIRVVRSFNHKMGSKETSTLDLTPLHLSETALDNADFDYEIINDGTIEDLVEKVKEILIKEEII